MLGSRNTTVCPSEKVAGRPPRRPSRDPRTASGRSRGTWVGPSRNGAPRAFPLVLWLLYLRLSPRPSPCGRLAGAVRGARGPAGWASAAGPGRGLLSAKAQQGRAVARSTLPPAHSRTYTHAHSVTPQRTHAGRALPLGQAAGPGARRGFAPFVKYWEPLEKEGAL